MKILSSTSASNYPTVNRELNRISIDSITIYGNHTHSHFIQNKRKLDIRISSIFLLALLLSCSLYGETKGFLDNGVNKVLKTSDFPNTLKVKKIENSFGDTSIRLTLKTFALKRTFY